MQDIADTRDATRDATGDVTWMTYAELGKARGIDAASAKRLAIRRHWRRTRGNTGTARVAVPVTEATPRETRPGDATEDVTRDVTAFQTALAAVEATHERHVADLRAAHTREVAGLRAQVDGLRGDLEHERAAAQQQREITAQLLGLLHPHPPESDPPQGTRQDAPQGGAPAPAATPPESGEPPPAHAPRVRRWGFRWWLGGWG
jgi:hypothetical protein